MKLFILQLKSFQMTSSVNRIAPTIRKNTIRYSVIFLLSVISCNSANDSESGTSTDTAKKPAGTSTESKTKTNAQANMSTNLDILYIQNDSAKPQLDNLITKPQHKEKLTIQFHHTDSGKLTIGLWPSKKKNQNIDTSKVEIAKNLRGHFDISNYNIFLGDQQIHDTIIAKLRTVLFQPQHKFIFFTPRMVPGNHVVYDISSGGDLTTTSVSSFGSTNPSPPKDAY